MDEQDGDKTAWLRCCARRGWASTRLRALLRAAGDIHGALERARRAAATAPGSRAAATGCVHPDRARLAADAAWLQAPGHRLLCCTDEDFPPQLECMPDPPAALFVDGDPGLLLQPQVAIVGARNASPGGRRNAAAFARALGECGLVVTSGLAEGIDAAAHEAALAASAANRGRGRHRAGPGLSGPAPEPGAGDRRAGRPGQRIRARAPGRGRGISRAATASSPAWPWAPWWSRPGCARDR